MRSRLIIDQDWRRSLVRHTVEIADEDMVRVRLSDSDRALLAFDASESKTPVADRLEMLALLVRRMEEQSSDGSTVSQGRADKTPTAQVTCESGRSLPDGGQS